MASVRRWPSPSATRPSKVWNGSHGSGSVAVGLLARCRRGDHLAAGPIPCPSDGVAGECCSISGMIPALLSDRHWSHVDNITLQFAAAAAARRADQMGATAGTLPPLEIAVAGRAALAGFERSAFIARHIEHPARAIRNRRPENDVKPSRSACALTKPAPRAPMTLAADPYPPSAARRRRQLAQILDAAVGARADETPCRP